MFGKKVQLTEDVSKKKKNTMIGFLFFILLFGYLVYSMQSSSKPNTGTPPVKFDYYSASSKEFQQSARDRLTQIAKSIPEVENFSCEGDDCSSVIYLNFKTLPEDLDFIIRGNTVTFSNFKKTLTGVSHVTFAAKLNGKVMLSCNGDNGIVRSCK